MSLSDFNRGLDDGALGIRPSGENADYLEGYAYSCRDAPAPEPEPPEPEPEPEPHPADARLEALVEREYAHWRDVIGVENFDAHGFGLAVARAAVANKQIEVLAMELDLAILRNCDRCPGCRSVVGDLHDNECPAFELRRALRRGTDD